MTTMELNALMVLISERLYELPNSEQLPEGEDAEAFVSALIELIAEAGYTLRLAREKQYEATGKAKVAS
jgi:hypothetical protein